MKRIGRRKEGRVFLEIADKGKNNEGINEKILFIKRKYINQNNQ